jgi:hypothetical protein
MFRKILIYFDHSELVLLFIKIYQDLLLNIFIYVAAFVTIIALINLWLGL